VDVPGLLVRVPIVHDELFVGYSTHGVGDSDNSKDGGNIIFYYLLNCAVVVVAELENVVDELFHLALLGGREVQIVNEAGHDEHVL
jgi:hypothetical protein